MYSRISQYTCIRFARFAVQILSISSLQYKQADEIQSSKPLSKALCLSSVEQTRTVLSVYLPERLGADPFKSRPRIKASFKFLGSCKVGMKSPVDTRHCTFSCLSLYQHSRQLSPLKGHRNSPDRSAHQMKKAITRRASEAHTRAVGPWKQMPVALPFS